MDIRANVYSPLQNTTVWLAAWLHGLESTDDLIDALTALGGEQLLEDGRGIPALLAELRADAGPLPDAGEEPVLRLVLSGPGEAPGLPAGSAAARATATNGMGALILRTPDPHHHEILVPRGVAGGTRWEWFGEDAPLPAPAHLSPGEADQLLARATGETASMIEASAYRSSTLASPRLTVGTLSDFYDTPGLPGATPPRAAKLFARADRVAAIIETVKERMSEHALDPQLLGLWRHIRQARMAGVSYAVREFGRVT